MWGRRAQWRTSSAADRSGCTSFTAAPAGNTSRFRAKGSPPQLRMEMCTVRADPRPAVNFHTFGNVFFFFCSIFYKKDCLISALQGRTLCPLTNTVPKGHQTTQSDIFFHLGQQVWTSPGLCLSCIAITPQSQSQASYFLNNKWALSLKNPEDCLKNTAILKAFPKSSKTAVTSWMEKYYSLRKT